MMFKTELHAHTKPVSRCAHVEADAVICQYEQSGYDTVVITNHMSPTLLNEKLPCDPNDWQAVADYYLSDYRLAKSTAKKVNVLLGMELRVHENMNDYLVYGIDEQFVYDMGNVFDMKIKDVIPMIHDAGGIILQAHPFRNNMTVTNPVLLDGIEAYNFSPNGYAERNEVAAMWAKRYDLTAICGQDYHRPNYIIGAGMLTEECITDEKQLVDIISSRRFKITDGVRILTE